MAHDDFSPDYRHVVDAARNRAAARLPLYEHIIGEKVIYETTGTRPYQAIESPDPAERLNAFAQLWEFWRKMGYDTASVEFCITPILPGGGALGAHRPGAIHTRADFDRYPWDELEDMYFERYGAQLDALRDSRPAGMKAVGGVGNGVFECVQDLTGYENLCYMRYDDPELYAALFERMGRVQRAIWRRFLARYSDAYCVLRFGDDLGFNTSTLLPREDIVRLVLPQYRAITNLVHASGRPFLLHSCGNLFSVFDDIIDLANIDAKHSNEDSIAHFAVWVERYGARIGNFGGVDTDVLCRQDEQTIRQYVLDCLERTRHGGGIAFGSGNSIPDYVPTEGFLAMVNTVRSWRGDTGRAERRY